MAKTGVFFLIFMWVLWLFFGYLIFFENPSRIYQLTADVNDFKIAVVIMIIWGVLLVIGTAASLPESDEEPDQKE